MPQKKQVKSMFFCFIDAIILNLHEQLIFQRQMSKDIQSTAAGFVKL